VGATGRRRTGAEARRCEDLDAGRAGVWGRSLSSLYVGAGLRATPGFDLPRGGGVGASFGDIAVVLGALTAVATLFWVCAADFGGTGGANDDRAPLGVRVPLGSSSLSLSAGISARAAARL